MAVGAFGDFFLVLANAALVNEGAVGVRDGTTALNGPLTTAAGSLLYVEMQGNSDATLTVAQGFVNCGRLQLTQAGTPFLSGGAATLTVTSGTLTNAPVGLIEALFDPYGRGRFLNAQLDNQGTVTVVHPLNINKSSADHTNSGTINLQGGDLILSQSGTTPTFTKTGAIVVPADRSFAVTSGGLTVDGSGILTGQPRALTRHALQRGPLDVRGERQCRGRLRLDQRPFGTTCALIPNDSALHDLAARL
jgi:hypothetical protein